MAVKESVPTGSTFSFHRPAFGRSGFIQKLCAENNDDRAAPIGDRIAKECAQVRFRIEKAVANYPANKQNDCDNAKRVATNRTSTATVVVFGHDEILHSPANCVRSGPIVPAGQVEARECGAVSLSRTLETLRFAN